MSTDKDTSRLKDIIVSAAVASVVSAIAIPMVRKWFAGEEEHDDDDDAFELEAREAPQSEPVEDDDYEVRVARLLEIPDPIPGQTASAMMTRGDAM